MNITEERKILDGIAAGDNLVIKGFYKENYNYIKGYILQNSGKNEDVEDVFQDALVIIYQKLKSDSLEINVTLRTYFYAVCKNVWRNRLRKNRRLVVTDKIIESKEESEEVIISNIENYEREQIYRKYFLNLSASCKELLTVVFAGKSMKQIADVMGYSEGYTRKKKYDCKKSLQEMIEKDPKYQELKITAENK